MMKWVLILLASIGSASAGQWIKLDSKGGACEIWSEDAVADFQLEWRGNCKNGKTEGKGAIVSLQPAMVTIIEVFTQKGVIEGQIVLREYPIFSEIRSQFDEEQDLIGKSSIKINPEYCSAVGGKCATEFTGYLKKGKLSQGTLKFSDGDSYTGDFSSDGKVIGRTEFQKKREKDVSNAWSELDETMKKMREAADVAAYGMGVNAVVREMLSTNF